MPIGRPKSESSKRDEIKVRVTKEDREKLLFCCEKTGMTQYQIVMKGIDEVYKQIMEELSNENNKI